MGKGRGQAPESNLNYKQIAIALGAAVLLLFSGYCWLIQRSHREPDSFDVSTQDTPRNAAAPAKANPGPTRVKVKIQRKLGSEKVYLPLAPLPWKRSLEHPTPVVIKLAMLPWKRSLNQAISVTIPLASLPWQDDAGVALPIASANTGEIRDESELPRFVMSLCRDLDGNLWIGAEDDDNHTGGVWRYDIRKKCWTHFTTKDGLGDDNAYALACDRKGRIWAGHLNHGVSVYNGEKWQCYDVVAGISRPDTLSGPLGERVFHITVNQKDGDVWIATNAGLARYSESKDAWSYYTRSNGLPSDQANSMAFDADGNIYVATQCDGIAMAKAGDDYKAWMQWKGLADLPFDPRGQGIPSNLINDVLVARDGAVYLATDAGLAFSQDKGTSWHFVRGKDWADKVRGRIGGPPAGWVERPGAMLAEDQITSLAEGDDGTLYLGYHKKGVESLTFTKGEIHSSQAMKKSLRNITTPLVRIDGKYFAGTYGEGIVSPEELKAKADAIVKRLNEIPKLPSGASPLNLEALNDELAAIDKVPPLDPAVTTLVTELPDDWATEGDWLGRYGRFGAILAAECSPQDYVWGAGDSPMDYRSYIGPHRTGDNIRYWISALATDNPTALEMPPVFLDSRIVKGFTTAEKNRRLAEWDDHGEAYLATTQGPDLYCSLHVPQGTFVLSLYEQHRDRDFQVSIWANPNGLPAEAQPSGHPPELTHARVIQARGGVYKKFFVCGPCDLTAKIGRNYSVNCNLAAMMLDRLDERPFPYFGSADEWKKLQKARSDKTQARLAAWHTKTGQTGDTGKSGTEMQAVQKLIDGLSEMPSWNPQWWAVNQRRLAVISARWCQANLAGQTSPDAIRLRGSSLYQAGSYPLWEACQAVLDKRTARQIEKSLRWDHVTPSYSGHGLETVMNYLASADVNK